MLECVVVDGAETAGATLMGIMVGDGKNVGVCSSYVASGLWSSRVAAGMLRDVVVVVVVAAFVPSDLRVSLSTRRYPI